MTLQSICTDAKSIYAPRLSTCIALVSASLMLSACTQSRTGVDLGTLGGNEMIYLDRSGTNYDTALLNISYGTNIFRPHLLSIPTEPVYAKND